MTAIRRILHVFGRMQRGGAEIRTLDVMKHLAPEGFISDVVVLSGLKGELDAQVEALGGRVHLCRRACGWRARFRQILRNGGYDVVHSHVHLFSGVLLREAARCRIPIRIAHFRSTSDGMGDNLIRRCYRWWMTKLIGHYATNILAVSRSTLAHAWPQPADPRCQVIYNGLDPADFILPAGAGLGRGDLGIPADSRVIMHVGNFTPPKNHSLLLRLFAALAQDDSRLHLVLIGGGETEEGRAARRFVDQAGLQQRVSFLGVRRDVPRLLHLADVFLFPSSREGLPGALLEACAVGVPCVVSDIAPCREVADRIPGVVCVGLDVPLAQWAQQVRKALAVAREPDAIGRLQRGGFDLAASIAAFRTVWTGG